MRPADQEPPPCRRKRDSQPLEAGGTAAGRGEAEAWARALAAGEAGRLEVGWLERLCGRRCQGRPACLRSGRADWGRVGQRMEEGLRAGSGLAALHTTGTPRSQADRYRLWECARPGRGSASRVSKAPRRQTLIKYRK